MRGAFPYAVLRSCAFLWDVDSPQCTCHRMLTQTPPADSRDGYTNATALLLIDVA